MKNLTRDLVREMIAEKGITTENVTIDQLELLRVKLRETLKKSECLRGSFRVRSKKASKFLTCKAFYFENREAISFNPDGFIGFAGWADSTNIIPILEATVKWLEDI